MHSLVALKASETDPKFAGKRYPLSRHMTASLYRYAWDDVYDANSERSRLDYIVYYIWDHIGRKPFSLALSDPLLVNDLNRTIYTFGPITTFWHHIWRRYFHDRFDIYSEHGYHGYLSHVAANEVAQRSIPLALIPDHMHVQLQSLQPGFHNPGFPRLFFHLWQSSEFYRDYYQDIDQPWVRDCFMLDQIVHTIIERDAPFLLPPEQERYWSQSAISSHHRISRFMLTLASMSRRFGQALAQERLSDDLANKIEQWWREEVVAETPEFARFAPALTPVPVNLDPARSHRLGGFNEKIKDTKGSHFKADRANGEIDVLIMGPIGATSGLGAGMRRTVGALMHLGINFRIQPSYFDNPSARILGEWQNYSYNGEFPKIIIWQFNAEYLYDVMLSMADFSPESYNIAYFFWETEAMPKAHELACYMVDEIWTPSEFCRDCYDGRDVPVINVGSSIELPKVGPYLTRAELGLAEDTFIVMFSFDSHSVIHRKNPAAVVRAFKAAFPRGDENVMLVLKTQNMATAHWNSISGRGEELLELCGSDPRIIFFDKTMTLQELYSLKAACNVYMSLHRSEGYGYGPAEAMAIGKPVIMTNYSANVEFATEDNCLLVDGPLIHVLRPEYLYWVPEMKWADPDVDDAAAKLRWLFENPDKAREIGMRAAKSINRDHGVEAMAAKIKIRLDELMSSGKLAA